MNMSGKKIDDIQVELGAAVYRHGFSTTIIIGTPSHTGCSGGRNLS